MGCIVMLSVFQPIRALGEKVGVAPGGSTRVFSGGGGLYAMARSLEPFHVSSRYETALEYWLVAFSNRKTAHTFAENASVKVYRRGMNQDANIAVGVGAVVFRGDDVLIIRRGKPPFAGQWSIPGGGVEYGEALQDALRREVREETGVEIENLRLLDVFEAPPGAAERDFQRHTIMIDYVAEWRSGAPRAGDDALEADFVSVKTALARLSWDLTRGAVRKAVEIRVGGAAAPRNG